MVAILLNLGTIEKGIRNRIKGEIKGVKMLEVNQLSIKQAIIHRLDNQKQTDLKLQTYLYK